MITQPAIEKLSRLKQYLTQNKQLVIDGDTHPGDTGRLEGELKKQYEQTLHYYQGRPLTLERLLGEMNLAGVSMALTWQNPSMITYSNRVDLNYTMLLLANREIFNFSVENPDKFIPAGWTDPRALGVPLALRMVEECVFEFGFPIIKMNPAQNGYPIDSHDVLTVVDRIVELGAVPAFHYGGDTPFTPAKGLEKIAKRHPRHPIIGVHMGGGGSHYVDGDAVNIESTFLGLRCPNLFFILSAKRDCYMEDDIIVYTCAGEPFTSNLACGSDAPYGRMTWNFGGFRNMFAGLKQGKQHPDKRVRDMSHLFTDELFEKLLGRNLANLVIRACDTILEKNGIYIAERGL